MGINDLLIKLSQAKRELSEARKKQREENEKKSSVVQVVSTSSLVGSSNI